MLRTLAALVLLCGCPGGSSSPTAQPTGSGPTPATTAGATPGSTAGSTPGSTGSPAGSPGGAAPAGPKLSEPCGAGDACGEGSCVSYRGIAGARGPEFKSCEIRCDASGGCPAGRTCITIADGPGQVCR